MTVGRIASGSRVEIPVRNLWLLMLYASRLYQQPDVHRHAVEESPEDLPNLVAEILANAAEARMQRNLSRDYRGTAGDLSRVRGRINLLRTETHQLLRRGRVACEFDELSVDIPRNRLIRTALQIGSAIVSDAAVAHRCRKLANAYGAHGVSIDSPTVALNSSQPLGRNEWTDSVAVDAARLLLRMQIPTEGSGRHLGPTAARDVREIRKLYEQAVRGFYRTTLQPPWVVRPGETIRSWPVNDCSPGMTRWLPVMRFDIVLETGTRRVIVETKFTTALAPGRTDSLKFKRDHIFQLYSYVQSQHGTDALSTGAEGVLLYPVVDQHIDEFAVIGGHKYRVLTVDLASSAADIRQALLTAIAAR